MPPKHPSSLANNTSNSAGKAHKGDPGKDRVSCTWALQALLAMSEAFGTHQVALCRSRGHSWWLQTPGRAPTVLCEPWISKRSSWLCSQGSS